MRVLLVQAFTALDMELVYPIGLAYLAAHLDGHAVSLFDLNLHKDDPWTALRARLAEFRPEVVGISLRNMKVGMPGYQGDDFGPQQETIEVIRAAVPGVRVIAGGTAFSLYAEAMMRRHGVSWLSTTHKSIEEIATTILRDIRPDRLVY